MPIFVDRRRGYNSIQSVYEQIIQKDAVIRECFPLMSKLYYLSVIMAPSTAVVERSFSLMGNILTKQRNRLSQRHLDSVMRICHQKRELSDADLEALVDLFKGIKVRHLKL